MASGHTASTRLFDAGGSVEAIKNGYIASRIDDNRGARQDQLDKGERLMVGHSVFEARGHSAGEPLRSRPRPGTGSWALFRAFERPWCVR